MTAELLIRPASNDHQVVADLLAPGSRSTQFASGRPPISRLVVDAHIAQQRPLFMHAAVGAGIPYLIDPLTHLLQGELRPEDRWASLPYGQAKAIQPEDLASEAQRDDLVQAVVDYEVEAGATIVIPPYLYSSGPDDPWFPIALDLVRRTALYMRHSGIRLPMTPVICGQLQGFGQEKSWLAGLDAFAQAALESEVSELAVCLSPVGAASDGYNKVLRLFAAAERLASSGLHVLGWRQGIYGPGLVAAGLVGYETGIGTSEQCNIARGITSRRPKPEGQRRSGGASPRIFLEPLGRSVPAAVAQGLLGDLRMRAKVMCDDERCCPDGPASTLDQHREHAVRARARALAEIDEMPQRTWKLHRVARNARAAATLIAQANKTLHEAKIKEHLDDTSATSLAQVAEYLSQTLEHGST